MGFRTSAGKAALSAVVAGGALLGSATPALADDPNTFVTYAFGTCDTTTGNWIVDWQLTNGSSDETATLVDPTYRPTAYPIVGVPTTLAPKTTVHATQTLIGTPGLTSDLVFNVQWSDGSTQLVSWSFRPRTICRKA